jgi:hypothetical protein
MPTIQIAKLQIRRGPYVDLPNPSGDDGELLFANDVGRLFISQTTPTMGNANFSRNVLPYENIEILTELTPLDAVSPAFKDNQLGFYEAVPLSVTGSYVDLEVYDINHIAQDFYVDLPNSGANAIISYFVYDGSNNPLRVGKLIVIWNTTMVGEPYCTDDASIAIGLASDMTWKAHLIGSMMNQHVVLQYTNTVAGAVVYFKIDRPLSI